ncbi:MAG: hypothetical protein ISR61_00430 [Desulfobacteraceae bacterium]|uniref:HTH luxR-type domain-containing protein n=1 Tax=Candidatus Desulfacyla euxinica TaxID=2841693 RepID=A0A8J6T1Q3_9DELT|nr:hypothetical protein [Candidatus Desulfacyla euxinica]MBL6977380.1 hypothetical protein [Desulfobacteraceae bacterium]MBL7216635.1 hypothetical protein [Desulfobacteraceae bacterium]
MFIAVTTVKGHLQNIYGKLNVRGRRKNPFPIGSI